MLFRYLIILVAIVCLWKSNELAAQTVERPNIIFIMTDDQAEWAMENSGHPDARTPNMDQLAREGVRLTNCFVATPVCSASRAALMTSRYPTEVGITDYLSHKRQPDLGLDPELPVWPRFLKNAGYTTGLVGKWHLGQLDRFHPSKFGYQEFTGFRVGGMTSQNPKVEVEGEERTIEGWTPDILTDQAIDFVKRHQQGPFCLSLHFWAPHANAHVRESDQDRTWLPLSEEDWGPFAKLNPTIPNPDFPKLDLARVKRMTREYLASIHSVDRNLGRLLSTLDQLKLTENTMVIFTSDHGYQLGHNGIWHKGNGRKILVDDRSARPNLWDHSLRVPALVRWPNGIPAGKTVPETITFLDWFPSFLAMANVSLPEEILIRGRNILPLLKGEKQNNWNNDLFSQYRMWDWNQTAADLRTYRTQEWKLVRDFRNENRDELYHLAVDPAEHVNLIDSKDDQVRAILNGLNDSLRKSMLSIDDPAL